MAHPQGIVRVTLEQLSMFLAILLAPWAAFGFAMLTNPIAAWISRHLREGWLKRLLFISWKV
jgi:hypothetical protein